MQEQRYAEITLVLQDVLLTSPHQESFVVVPFELVKIRYVRRPGLSFLPFLPYPMRLLRFTRTRSHVPYI